MAENAVTIDLGYRPHKYQLQIHRQARRFTVVVAHRRFGKTYAAIRTLMHSALATRRTEARFAYIAPYLKQAKGTSWDYLKAFSGKIPSLVIREGDLSIGYPNGSRITLYGADNAEAIRGLYFDGIVPDEMADFDPNVWGSILRPTLVDRDGWSLFIGTPKGVNQFSELYQRAASGRDPDWAGLMFRADETGLIKPAELEAARRDMSDAQYRQEFLCDFSASSDNTLITIDVVSAAAARVFQPADLEGMPKILGVDIARYGDDSSVIIQRQGFVVNQPKIFHGADNMAMVGYVSSMIDQWRPDAVFIDAGRGEGVIDRLRQLGYNIIEVNFGGKPMEPSYTNKRSEMWDTMAEWLKSGGGLPNHPQLKSELSTPTYSFKGENKFDLESKDDIKKRLLRSPDIADALALTFAFPVTISRGSHGLRPRPSTNRGQPVYNPFAEIDRDRGGNDPYRMG